MGDVLAEWRSNVGGGLIALLEGGGKNQGEGFFVGAGPGLIILHSER